MADNLTPDQRSRAMASVRSRDTSPERLVRSCVHRMGYRFRLHRRDLPGTPDLVLSTQRAVILVHGCFWHGHRCRAERPKPKTNAAFWRSKLIRNQRRDRGVLRALRVAGWRVLVLWECEVRRPNLPTRLRRFIEGRSGSARSTTRQ